MKIIPISATKTKKIWKERIEVLPPEYVLFLIDLFENSPEDVLFLLFLNQNIKDKERILESHDEEELAGGILRKFTETPKSVKRGLMILAVGGVILSVGKAFAGGKQ